METINDILREMRIGDIRATANTSSAIERKAFEYINDFLNGYADRIEAATKALEADRDNWREQAFAEASRANAATCKESLHVGNAAKMREALEKVVEIAKREWNAFRETSAMYEMHEICTAALAEPLRNCDVGTAEEQYSRFYECCKYQKMPCLLSYDYRCEECYSKWAQMPYKKESEMNDDTKTTD
jgi:phage shock protein A